MGHNNEHTLEQVESEMDIGVTLDKKLTFKVHMTDKVKKSNGIMELIRRTFEHMDTEMFTLLFKSLVCPHIEYANQVWAPYLMKHVKALENVQWRGTKLVPGLSHLSYPERHLDMPTLACVTCEGRPNRDLQDT